MTESQKKAKFGSFLSAGYAAFHAAYFDVNSKRVVPINNPYREAPFRDLWAKGWRDAEREFKRGIQFRHVGYTDDRTFDDKRQKFFKPKYVAKKPAEVHSNHRPGTRVHTQVATGSGIQGGGLNLHRLENKFNKKRTKV